MRKPTEDRKREIVKSVLDLTEVSGVGSVSTTAVAGVIGISQPAIFRHFPTKAALWQGVADYLITEMTARWRHTLAQPLGPLALLVALAEAQLLFIARHPAVLDIVFSRQLHKENAALRTVFQQAMARLSGHFESLAGDAAPGISPSESRDMALVIVGMIQATAFRWSLHDKGFDLVAEGRRLVTRQAAMLSKGGDQ